MSELVILQKYFHLIAFVPFSFIGEDVANPHIGLVDARLNLLALMEGLVRSGMSIPFVPY